MWIAIYKCVSCREELEAHEEMYNHGVCPKCGHVSRGTICDTIKSSKEIRPKLPKESLWARLKKILKQILSDLSVSDEYDY